MMVDFIKSFTEVDCTEVSSGASSYPTINNVKNGVNCVRTAETFLKPN